MHTIFQINNLLSNKNENPNIHSISPCLTSSFNPISFFEDFKAEFSRLGWLLSEMNLSRTCPADTKGEARPDVGGISLCFAGSDP